MDTGGILFDDDAKDDCFAERIKEQAVMALHEAHAAILLCDSITGLTKQDLVLAHWLRKNMMHVVPIFVALNKCDRTLRPKNVSVTWLIHYFAS